MHTTEVLSLTTNPASRAASVVDRVLVSVAMDAERSYATLRLVALLLIGVGWAVVVGPELVAGGRTAWLVEGIIGLGVVGGAAHFIRLRQNVRNPRRLSRVSVIIDTVLAGAVAIVIAVAPPSDYIGVLHATGVAIVDIAVVAAGLRLSRRNALLSGAIGAASLCIAFAIDQKLNAAITQEGGRHLAIALVLVAVATLIGWSMAARTRTVALETARQSLMAERGRAHLGAYVSAEVADLSLQTDHLTLDAVATKAAVLFTDLRSFTSSTENADAATVVRELNAYFEVMVAAVVDNGGVVDKYIGDALMAVFGVPSSKGDDAGNAIRAAAAMQAGLLSLNAARARRNLPGLQHGIGVHYGELVAGNIGTANRAQFTVIGDVVNVASRLESNTKALGVEVLLSAAVVEAAQSAPPVIAAGDDGGIFVKGRAAPIPVFTLAVASAEA